MLVLIVLGVLHLKKT